jgi:hypothetical protein
VSGGQASADLGYSASAAAIAPSSAPKAGGPGRPKGSRNKSTLEMVRWIGEKFGKLPIEEACRLAMATPREIIAECGVDHDKAWAIKTSMLAAVLPYTSSKMPQALEVTKTERFFVVQLGELPPVEDEVEGGYQLDLMNSTG